MSVPDKTIVTKKLAPGESRCWNPVSEQYETFNYPVRWSTSRNCFIRTDIDIQPPKGSSKEYPGWICRSGCMENSPAVPEDYKGDKCPNCWMPTLIRYLKYEVKK